MSSLPDKPLGLSDYLAAAKYRRLSLIVTFTLAVIATAALALLLPSHYRSAGTILIEQQEMPQELVRSTVTSYADERVQVISKRVMTTDTLLGIIKRYDLYPKIRAKETREALLARMRKDIGLKMISADVIDPRSGHPTSATIAFEVSYTSESPDLAARVANELTTLYLNENLNNRTQLARDAATFLESEGDRLNRRIGELEAQLEKFKEKHFKQLPEQTQFNMQLLDRTQEDLRNLEARESSLQQQQVFLEAQLALLKPNSTVFSDTGERIVSTADRLKMARSQLDNARAIYAPDHPDVVRLEREVAGLEQDVAKSTGVPTKSAEAEEIRDLKRRLQDAEASLVQAQERYAPDHPDRIRLQREVDTLKAELDAKPEPPPATATAATARKLTPSEADNPAFVQIQAQLSATLNDLQGVRDQMEKLRTRASQFQNDVRLAPQVEQQYRELTRDYENTRIKYQEVRSKQSEAKTAQDLEADRKGERFTLIEPPLPPEEPVSPNRKLILVAGIILSGGLAFGVLWLLEKLDTSVRSRFDLTNLTGVAPLALVPHIGTDAEYRIGRRRKKLALGATFACLCIAVALTHFFYQPLDVLWFTLTRRIGF